MTVVWLRESALVFCVYDYDSCRHVLTADNEVSLETGESVTGKRDGATVRSVFQSERLVLSSLSSPRKNQDLTFRQSVSERTKKRSH